MPAVKLEVGDLMMIALGLGVMLMMTLMSAGRQGPVDPDAERRSNEKYLNVLQRHRSPILTFALIVALGGVAYVLTAVYYKTL